MRIIVCGIGRVGYSIASYLSREPENDVTVIDSNAALVGSINDEMDVHGIVGHASNPDILALAGAADADMIIAVTHSDEVNMVACQVAHSLFGVSRKIARLSNAVFLNPLWHKLFSREHMPIDFIISPEVEVAKSIHRRLSVPGTSNVVSLADGSVHMVGVRCEENCPVVNTQLKQLMSLFPDLKVKIGAILRGSEVIYPTVNDQMLVGDEVYLFVETEHLKRVLSVFGHEEEPAKNIVILGGGNIGLNLADLILENKSNINLKLIERDGPRARYISEHLNNKAIVLHGEGLSKTIIQQANIENADALVTVTNDDEANILSSLIAKQLGCKRVLTLVTNEVYTDLINSLDIDVQVSPKAATVSKIMQFVRKGSIKNIHSLKNGFAEVFEATVQENSEIANVPISELRLPKGILIGMIIHDEVISIPVGDTVIREGDHVIIFADKALTPRVERFFSYRINLV
jgi:trk system potassium uptake protein TrkA